MELSCPQPALPPQLYFPDPFQQDWWGSSQGRAPCQVRFSPTNELQDAAGTESEIGILLLSIPWELSSLLGENSPSQLHQDLRIRAE